MAGIISNSMSSINIKKLYNFLKYYTFKTIKGNKIDENPLRVYEL